MPPDRVGSMAAARGWSPLGEIAPGDLVDARLQLHHAARLANAAAMSFLPPRPDDGHTNFEWLDAVAALVAQPVPVAGGALRMALRPADLTLLAVNGVTIHSSMALHGRTMSDGAAWIRGMLAASGLDASALTLAKHYEIPHHAVASGAVFDAMHAGAFAELARWWHDADGALRAYARATPGASSVRCWPHHFDIATLVAREASGDAVSVGAGMSPGDSSYAEPYFYVTPYPYPAPARLPPLPHGVWHTSGWTGAVLTGTAVATVTGSAQSDLVAEFIAASTSAAWRALRPD